MRIYKATLFDHPRFGDARPVMIDGHEVSEEIVAETAGKARYRFYLDLSDAWGASIRFQDIRVYSLSRTGARSLEIGWEQRLEKANAIVRVIGSYGRHFLSENSDRRDLVKEPFFGHFRVDKRNEVWWIDRYTRKPVLLRHREWKGFSDGGTLRSVVTSLANFIHGGYRIHMSSFGPWPKWICTGDLWGYGADMQKVRDGIRAVLAEEDIAA